ncbi:MAG TPA: neutral/alkaline non-lysosomal ceramidase N-terminal domain-containing protein [Candidatus Acidoferrum sp.]|nr:neutral/alkaline non-lysosomal ceramidase N-terminal domain-containing protein [Candidatus Acidoferrum sp.]
MKRTVLWSLRILGGSLVVLGIGVVVCFEGVDYRPYMHEPYYAETAARLHGELATNRTVHGELSAGFGRALLSPTVDAAQDEPLKGQFRSLPLAGYGNRHGRPARGVHDDLYVKAVALRVEDRLGVMVAADALIVPAEVTEEAMRRLAKELKLSREQIYLSATHTHSSVGGWGEGKVAEAFAGGYRPGIRTWFADRIVTAVRDATADLKPAEFGRGRFKAAEFVRNRLVGEKGRVDPEFSFVVLKQKAGTTAVLGSYAAHATVLSGDMMEFSADYPGCWERAMEQATSGMALFLAGGVGSSSQVPGADGFAGAERMGQALAAALLEQLPHTALTNRLDFGLLGLDVSLPPLNVRVTDGVRLRPWLASDLLSVRKTCLIQAFRLGDSLWVSTPCDFSAELALEIKDSLKAIGASTVVTSFNGDYIGYVIPLRYYHLNGYEPRLMSFFGPNVPDYFEEMIRTMAVGLASR